MTSAPRALVIGGGIAGPALALFLARDGIEPVVFEAHPRNDHLGGGFQVAPNGLRVLAALGLADAIVRAGHPSRDFCFKNHRGKTIGLADTGSAGIAVNIARGPLHRILRDEVARQGITMHHGKRLRDIAVAGREIVATFDDGSTDVGDFLVGADGVHSRVRAWMLPEHARPRDTRMISIGGFCSADVAPPPDADDADRLTFVVGPKHQLGYSKMSATRWGWWCHAAFSTEEEKSALLTMRDDDVKARMLERYAGWAPPAGGLIAGTESWLRTAIHDVPTLPTWHRGRVVLLGDAAHAMSPAGGQGASLALEDAMLLSKLVAGGGGRIEEAFARFETMRRKRAEAMVAQGYANDQRSLKELGPVGMWVRDTMMMPMIAPLLARALKRVYAGDDALRGA